MRERELTELKVRDLRPTSRWFTLTVKILEVGEEKTVFSRRDGSQHRVAEALVGDETGTILFSLWDDDIDRVRELVGSSITVRNGYVVLFRGSMRLALGRFGTIEEAEREVTKVDETVNMSERKYESRRPPRRRQRRRFA